jgi:chromosome segregation ATPase
MTKLYLFSSLLLCSLSGALADDLDDQISQDRVNITATRAALQVLNAQETKANTFINNINADINHLNVQWIQIQSTVAQKRLSFQQSLNQAMAGSNAEYNAAMSSPNFSLARAKHEKMQEAWNQSANDAREAIAKIDALEDQAKQKLDSFLQQDNKKMAIDKDVLAKVKDAQAEANSELSHLNADLDRLRQEKLKQGWGLRDQ